MFFLGKIFWLVFQPLTLICLAMLACISALVLGRRKAAFFFATLAFLAQFVMLYTTAGSVALQALENRYKRPSLPAGMTCMIVLGGAIDLDVTAGRGSIEFNQSADRFTEAVRLALLVPDSKIVISGGDGSFSATNKGDAELAPELFKMFGLNPDRIVMETASRNTAENVSNTKSLLQSHGLANCLLITSAYHMPRAVELFTRQGIAVTPWPTDYRTNGRKQFTLDFTQPTLNTQISATAMREWIALFAMNLKSR